MFNAKCLFSLFIINYLLIASYCQSKDKFFRKDYIRLNSTESFYKFHPEQRSWHAAKMICDAEGASLFYPEDETEACAVLKYWNRSHEVPLIHIGISTPYSKDIFETVDGKLINDVYCKWGRNQPDDWNGAEECVAMDRSGLLYDKPYDVKLPFVCKKTISSVDWNVLCDLPDTAYEYADTLGRCYKMHLELRKWSDAYAICRLEQAYLAVINSDGEAKHLTQLINKTNIRSDPDEFVMDIVYLGFKKTNGWRTIADIPLHSSGYHRWGDAQPDGFSGGQEHCGSMFFNGRLNDHNCDDKAYFICEREIPLLKLNFDVRFGVQYLFFYFYSTAST